MNIPVQHLMEQLNQLREVSHPAPETSELQKENERLKGIIDEYFITGRGRQV